LNNAKSESTSNTAAAATFQINTSQPIPPDSPALVIRTTGTTGTAKNVVHTRRLFYRTPPAQPGDLILIQQNLDWISGTVSILVRVLSGAKAEVLPTNPGPAAIWERLRRGGVTSLTDHSWFWVKLATYFQEHIETLPETERAEYVRGAQGLRWAFIVGTPPPLWLLGFWKEVFGCVLRVGYVATELGAVTLMTSADEEYIEVRL
jgi:malonyl-CoA/methylmalonyl-CoA synthetase